jgi:HTH-type transcriptional regulator/antitoxin HipB
MSYRQWRCIDFIVFADILPISPLRISAMQPVTHATQIGATLQARRKALKLSQTDVGNRLGLSQNRISELESHPQTLTVEQLLGLLNVLGLEMGIREQNGTPTSEW